MNAPAMDMKRLLTGLILALAAGLAPAADAAWTLSQASLTGAKDVCFDGPLAGAVPYGPIRDNWFPQNCGEQWKPWGGHQSANMKTSSMSTVWLPSRSNLESHPGSPPRVP